MAVSCTKNLSIHVAGATAPCSIFESDNTSFGEMVLDTTPFPGYDAKWTSLPPGAYKFFYIGGTFDFGGQHRVCANIGFATLGAGSPDTTAFIPSTDFPIGVVDPNPAVVIADYLTREANMPTFQVGAVIPDVIFGQVGTVEETGFTPASSDVTFEVVRTSKLIAPQPATMSIHNLATYATSRFVATYGIDTSALAFNAASGSVQTALNLLPNIISDGGVTCAGSLATGMAVTWNVNGARSALSGRITTISPGWEVTVIQTQVGNGGQPSIQTLFVTPICDEFIQNLILPDYNGSIPHRLLLGTGTPKWYFVDTTNPAAPTNQICGIEYQNTRVSLQCGPDAPSSAPTLVNGGAGNVPAGSHEWLVTFTSNLVQFSNTDSGPGPSSSLVLGGASQVNLSNIPLGPAGTTARNIYRTRAGETAFRLVGTISDNTTTVFTDNVDDASIFFPPNPASRWWALNISCVFNNPPAVELDIWEGYKLTGLDPTGTYSVRPNYFDGTGTCRQIGSGVQSITLDGVF